MFNPEIIMRKQSNGSILRSILQNNGLEPKNVNAKEDPLPSPKSQGNNSNLKETKET